MSIQFTSKEHSANANTASFAGLTQGNNRIPLIAAGFLVVSVMSYLALKGNSQTEAPNLSLAIGQSITLENPNGGLSHMTAGPGMMSASVSEEDQEQSICTAQAGTHGIIEEQQVIDMLSYVKIKLTDGECQGKSGWTTKMNVKGSA